MRQYELAIRIAQVHHLVDERKYKKALAVIQTLDMRQVRSLSDLKVFAEVYTRTEQFDAAKATYLRIYRRSQTRRVLHRLIYLSIRTDALDEAEMYYQEFVRTNPNERDALIMRYRIDKARSVPIGRLIEILQDLKQEEYIEEWAYELAKLYHRAGRREECIAECEDILLWFGTGEIVERAKILIDHLEERDPIPYYDDKDFTEPRKEEPNPDDTGSLPDLNEFIKKRKAQKKGERLAGSAARREEKAFMRQEEKKAAREKEEPKPMRDKGKLPETEEELEKEIDRQLENYGEEDEMDRELSLKAAKKAQAQQDQKDRAVKEDKADTVSEEFIDDYQEDESFEDMDLPKKAMDGIQKLLKFGKKEEDKEKDKNKESQERAKEEPEQENAEEKPKAPVPSANTGGEREYVPHSQSGTGITQDLAREISAIYEMEHKEQLQEKGVTVINDAPSNIATDLVERMNQALQHAPKKYIPLDVEEINGQDTGILEGDTKDLSKDTDAWVDEAVTKDLSRHSAVLNRQERREAERREARRKPPFRREVSERNSARDARERLMNIVENRREQREDIVGERNALEKAKLAEEQQMQETLDGAAESGVDRSVLPEDRTQVPGELPIDMAVDAMAEPAGEFPADTMFEAHGDVEEQLGLAEQEGELPADTAVEEHGDVEEQLGLAEREGEFLADTEYEAFGGVEEVQSGLEGSAGELPSDTEYEAFGDVEEQPGLAEQSEEFPGDTAVEATGDVKEWSSLEGQAGEFPSDTVYEGADGVEEQPDLEDQVGELPSDTVYEVTGGVEEQPVLEGQSGEFLADTAVEAFGDEEEQPGLEEMPVEPSADMMADSVEEPSENETELLRQLLEGEVEEPDELSELSEEVEASDGQGALEDLLEDVAEPSALAAGSGKEYPEETFGRTVFRSVQPQAFGEELRDEPEAEVGEQESSGEAVFHSVEPQAADLDLEEQLKAEVEELERGLGERELYEEKEWEEPEPLAGDTQGGAQEPEEIEREEPIYGQEPEQIGEGPAYEQEPEHAGEEPVYEQELERVEEEAEYGPEAEAARIRSAYGQGPERIEEEAVYGQEPERVEETAYEQEPGRVEEEPAYKQEPEQVEEEPAYGPEAEAARVRPAYEQEPEQVEEEPEYEPEAEATKVRPAYGQEPERVEEEPEYGQEAEAARARPAYEPEPEQEAKPARREPAFKHAQEQPRERSKPVREPAEEPVNRLSQEMATYRAPKIPVVETEYMEMPEITYDELPTTRALQESFDYVLQLIEGELEPSHFVLMGDGTERIVGVAKRIVRVMKSCGYISRGRIAKIHAKQLNKMDLISFRSQLFGNCLLIDGAADLLFPTITRMFSIMEEYHGNFVVILADEGTTLDQLFRFVPALAKRFQYIIDISQYTSEDYE